jgi:hypothetical protein
MGGEWFEASSTSAVKKVFHLKSVITPGLSNICGPAAVSGQPFEKQWTTYVCMYICMYVCMYECTHVRIYVCMYVCVYVCIHAYMYVCMYVFIHVCIYVWTSLRKSQLLCVNRSVCVPVSFCYHTCAIAKSGLRSGIFCSSISSPYAGKFVCRTFLRYCIVFRNMWKHCKTMLFLQVLII